MASKYDALRKAMNGAEVWNDKAANGLRILKWYAKTSGASLKERKKQAEEIFNHLRILPYVVKVTVRNCEKSKIEYMGKGRGDDGGDWKSFTFADTDKIAVYVDTSKL